MAPCFLTIYLGQGEFPYRRYSPITLVNPMPNRVKFRYRQYSLDEVNRIVLKIIFLYNFSPRKSVFSLGFFILSSHKISGKLKKIIHTFHICIKFNVENIIYKTAKSRNYGKKSVEKSVD